MSGNSDRRSRRPTGKRPELLSDGPIVVLRNWVSLVNKPQTEDEINAMHRSLARGTPFGGERWTARIAKRLGFESTMNPRGRPANTN